MTERKFTEEVEDKEVIKALECCCVSAEGNCRECPLINDYSPCSVTLTTNALDLITQQKAEIERLKKELRLITENNGGFMPSVIDNLVKETTEGN